MKNSRNLLAKVSLILFCALIASTVEAQCGKFTDSPKEDEGLQAHVLYRDMVKLEKYDEAFDNWKIAYEIAPAADGKRPFHFTDGRKIYLHKHKNETDAAKKKEYAEIIMRLFDEQIACYGADGEAARLEGRKVFAMYYNLRTPYGTAYPAAKAATKMAGNNAEYSLLQPFADMAVYQFEKGKIDKAEAREVHATINAIADHNIEGKTKYAAQYEATKKGVNAKFAKIENDIFDCEYFVNKYKPQYEADPKNTDLLKSTIATLKRRGCEESEPFLAKLEAEWSQYAAAENARIQAEFEANNPAFIGKKLYDEGKYAESIAKYREALEQETDDEKKADIYFRIASIQGRKMGQYGQARTNAYNAAKLREGWGRPYMLIGDLYAKASRTCGNDGYTRGLVVLAAIDKYSKAKAIDASVSAEANKRISTYRKSMPEKGDVFMRGKDGKSDKVGCWIGETVKVRYQ